MPSPIAGPHEGVETITITGTREGIQTGNLYPGDFGFETPPGLEPSQPWIPEEFPIRPDEDDIRDILEKKKVSEWERLMRQDTGDTARQKREAGRDFDKLMERPYLRTEDPVTDTWKEAVRSLVGVLMRNTAAQIALEVATHWAEIQHELKTDNWLIKPGDTVEDTHDWTTIKEIAGITDESEFKDIPTAAKVQLWYKALDNTLDLITAQIVRDFQHEQDVDRLAELLARRNLLLDKIGGHTWQTIESFKAGIRPGSAISRTTDGNIEWDPQVRDRMIRMPDGTTVRTTWVNGTLQLRINTNRANRAARTHWKSKNSLPLPKETPGTVRLSRALQEHQWQVSQQLDVLPDLEFSDTPRPDGEIEFRIKVKPFPRTQTQFQMVEYDHREHRIRYREGKWKSQMRYLHLMGLITKTFGKLTEIGDLAQSILDSYTQEGTGDHYRRWDTLWKDMKAGKARFRMDNLLLNVAANELGDRMGAAMGAALRHSAVQSVGGDMSHPSLNQGPMDYTNAQRGMRTASGMYPALKKKRG